MDYIYEALNSINEIANSKTSTYYNQDGIKVPRVTEILSKMIHSDGLMYWANNMGLKGYRYKDIMNAASNIGTIAHNAIEKFLQENIKSENNIPFMGFMMWYNAVLEGTGCKPEIVYIEHKMACKWFGGTLDGLIRIGNRLFLIDFKTSNHITYNYFLQIAAYRYMLRVVENIVVDGVIVLQLDKEEPGFNEYLLDFMIPSHLDFINQCEITFMALVYAYHNLYKVEAGFNKIFKEEK